MIANQVKSVECFKIACSSTWKYLPTVNDARSDAMAEALVFGRKYV